MSRVLPAFPRLSREELRAESCLGARLLRMLFLSAADLPESALRRQNLLRIQVPAGFWDEPWLHNRPCALAAAQGKLKATKLGSSAGAHSSPCGLGNLHGVHGHLAPRRRGAGASGGVLTYVQPSCLWQEGSQSIWGQDGRGRDISGEAAGHKMKPPWLPGVLAPAAAQHPAPPWLPVCPLWTGNEKWLCMTSATALSNHPSLKLALNAGRGRASQRGVESITAFLHLDVPPCGCPQEQE